MSSDQANVTVRKKQGKQPSFGSPLEPTIRPSDYEWMFGQVVAITEAVEDLKRTIVELQRRIEWLEEGWRK
jgi:hypothetical protein